MDVGQTVAASFQAPVIFSIAQDLTKMQVLTNIDEKWSDVYVAAVTELRAGKLVGNYVAYGYNTPASSGADLRYSADRALNTAVPASVASELEGLKKKFASGELKVKPVKDDARGGA